MKTKDEVSGLNLRQRFEQAGLACDAMTVTIGGFTKSSNEKTGNVYTAVLSVINKQNKIEQFVGKVFAGKGNTEHIESTNEYFKSFKAGDYVLQNVNLHVKGEHWDGIDKDDKPISGIYSDSFIGIPFVSNILLLGDNAIMTNKENEIKLAKM